MGIFDWLFGKNNKDLIIKDFRNTKIRDEYTVTQNGFGKITFGNGNTYEGIWKYGLKHGKGKEIDSSGNIINEGLWEEGKFVG